MASSKGNDGSLPLEKCSETLSIGVPRKLAPLLQSHRYKGAYGGRGGGKSHFFAEMLLARCYGAQIRAACIREVQNSLKESVRQLLIDKIQKMGLGWFFDVLGTEIRSRNGSIIIFKGMQSYNAENIKSLEGFDIAWVEEAQTLSAHSLKLLRPTLRREGSELWFSWNPRHDTDAVDRFFRGGRQLTGGIAVEVNWNDNPWFPSVLRQEKDDDYASDPETAEHVWGGGYEIATEGAYYAKLLHASERAGRIGNFPHDTTLPVNTAWDLGIDDYTAIWFLQDNGHDVFAIDYYEVSNEGAEQIVRGSLPELNPDTNQAAAQMIDIGRKHPFAYGCHYVPHDIKVREWGAGGKQRALTLMGFGVKPLRIGVATNPADRINAVRKLLPVCHFNNTGRVQVGLSRLRRYARKWNDSMQSYTTPMHDINSHGADAFGEYAINCGIMARKPRPLRKKQSRSGQVVLEGPPPPASTKRIRI
jgi:phage terminase large subunit